MKIGEDKKKKVKPNSSNDKINWKNLTMVSKLKDNVLKAARFIHYK